MPRPSSPINLGTCCVTQPTNSVHLYSRDEMPCVLRGVPCMAGLYQGAVPGGAFELLMPFLSGLWATRDVSRIGT